MKPIRFNKKKTLNGLKTAIRINSNPNLIRLMPVRVGRWLIAIDTSAIDYDDDSPSSTY